MIKLHNLKWLSFLLRSSTWSSQNCIFSLPKPEAFNKECKSLSLPGQEPSRASPKQGWSLLYLRGAIQAPRAKRRKLSGSFEAAKRAASGKMSWKALGKEAAFSPAGQGGALLGSSLAASFKRRIVPQLGKCKNKLNTKIKAIYHLFFKQTEGQKKNGFSKFSSEISLQKYWFFYSTQLTEKLFV